MYKQKKVGAIMKRRKKKKGMPVIILILLVVLIGVGTVFTTSYLYMKEKYAGSHKAYSYSLIRNLEEGSKDYEIAKKFYSDEEWESIRNNSLNITDDSSSESENIDSNGIEIKHVYGSTYQGYLMLVHNPEDISVAVNPYLGTSQGAPELETYVSMYNAVEVLMVVDLKMQAEQVTDLFHKVLLSIMVNLFMDQVIHMYL